MPPDDRVQVDRTEPVQVRRRGHHDRLRPQATAPRLGKSEGNAAPAVPVREEQELRNGPSDIADGHAAAPAGEGELLGFDRVRRSRDEGDDRQAGGGAVRTMAHQGCAGRQRRRGTRRAQSSKSAAWNRMNPHGGLYQKVYQNAFFDASEMLQLVASKSVEAMAEIEPGISIRR